MKLPELIKQLQDIQEGLMRCGGNTDKDVMLCYRKRPDSPEYVFLPIEEIGEDDCLILGEAEEGLDVVILYSDKSGE